MKYRHCEYYKNIINKESFVGEGGYNGKKLRPVAYIAREV